MEFPEHYTSDLLFYFDGKPRELTLYQCLEARMEEQFPEASVKVQKTQISFYGRHLFAAVSLPLRRRKAWPEHCILVTFGLSRRLESPPGGGSGGALSRPLDAPCGVLPGGAGGSGTDGLDWGGICVFPKQALSADRKTQEAERSTPMAEIIDFSGYQEEPELETMNREQLEEALRQVRERIAQLDEEEPSDMNSEEYETWGDAHEELEDLADEITDRLEELDG